MLAIAMQVSDGTAAAAGHHAGGAGLVAGGLAGSIVTAMAIGVVVLVWGLCLRYFLRPGEASGHHIKRRILE